MNDALTKLVEAIADLDEDDMGIIVECFKENCDTLTSDCQAALDKAYGQCKKLCQKETDDPRNVYKTERFKKLVTFREACADYLVQYENTL